MIRLTLPKHQSLFISHHLLLVENTKTFKQDYEPEASNSDEATLATLHSSEE